MSFWTEVHGIIQVRAVGRTQHEKEYILKTILDHLPNVTGSERDFDVYLIQKNNYNTSSSHDEFGERTNNLTTNYGNKSYRRGWLRTQDNYILVIDGSLRDRRFEQTFSEFNKWLNRLAKRVHVDDVMVKVSGCAKTDFKEFVFTNENEVYSEMFEPPTWSVESEGKPAWWEYLMWESDDYGYPRILAYRNFRDSENDKLVEHWMKWLNIY